MKNILPLLLLTPITTNAECTPTPDCASIGYTQTSCEGDSLKCPFNTTMLKCMPCDSSFKYTCDGENVASVVGSACGGKYVSCECVAGAVFNNGACICDTSCSVGNIYYSDKTCSSCLDNTKIPIGIVVKDNEIIIANDRPNIPWGSVGEISGLGTSLDTDYNGQHNTDLIVATLTNDTISTSGAVYCNEYSPTGMENTKGKWYMPAAGELRDYLYSNITKIHSTSNKLGLKSIYNWCWTSTSLNANYSYYFKPSNNGFGTYHKSSTNVATLCFLAI